MKRLEAAAMRASHEDGGLYRLCPNDRERSDIPYKNPFMGCVRSFASLHCSGRRARGIGLGGK